tara:strand:- start:2601 stop:3740 length:1140 start_codon:yes stop_codon:yes gene_type:complete
VKNKYKSLYEIFIAQGINFFVGVPDSLLAQFSSELEVNSNKIRHIVCPNEGNAIAAAIGYYAATKNSAVVYMQNSGLGNAVNPLVSLAHKKVWNVPIVLLIGWRGNIKLKDEPQHLHQGKITKNLLNLLGIKYQVYNEKNSEYIIKDLIKKANQSSSPKALLFKEKYISPNLKLIKTKPKNKNRMLRINVINTILEHKKEKDVLIATTGKTARELYLMQREKKIEHSDLFVVGGMGHASSIALGLLQTCANKKIFLLDGDGAFLMHMGILSLIGNQRKNIFIHILLNNEVHDSVGGQATAITNIDLKLLSKSMKYNFFKNINTNDELSKYLNTVKKKNYSYFLNVKIKPGSVSPLPRPKEIPFKNFKTFQKKILNGIIE